jgi:hypothetical protein
MFTSRPAQTSSIAGIFACLVLASCETERSLPVQSIQPEVPTQAWLDSMMESTVTALEKIRERRFPAKVQGVLVKRDSYDSLVFALSRLEGIDTADGSWSFSERTMLILGLTDTLGQWSRAQSSFDRGLVTGFYTPVNRTLYVFDDVGEQDRLYTVVHEMVHALQDESFGLDASAAWIRENDENVAFTTMLEGEAEYLSMALLTGETSAGMLKGEIDQSVFTLDQLATGFESWAKQRDIPMTMMLPMMAPYYMGPRLPSERRFRSGWSGVDSLFTHPVRTSRAALDPDLQDVVRDWNPGGCPAVPGVFRPLQTGRLGVLHLASLVWGNADSKLRLATLADSWRGDRFWTFHGDSGSGLLWRTAWKDSTTARAFARTWWLERAPRRTQWKTTFYSLADDTVKTASTSDNSRSVFVRVRGSEVDIVEGFATLETRDLEAKLAAIPARSLLAARGSASTGFGAGSWRLPEGPFRLPPSRRPGLSR